MQPSFPTRAGFRPSRWSAVTSLNFPLAAAVLILLLPGLSLAQETRGKILGRVFDPTGAAVPGAQIAITNAATNVVTKTETNTPGLYEAPYLLPGTYAVAAEAPGFKKYLRQGIELSVGAEVSIDIQFEVGDLAETVTVTADAPLLETTTGSVSATIDNRRINDLPIFYNNITAAVALMEGISTPGLLHNTLTIHFTENIGAADAGAASGTGSGANEFTIDGTPNASRDKKAAYVPVSDAIAEMRVDTARFDASSGHSSNATVSMLSKAGTNEFHGTVTGTHWQQRWNAAPRSVNRVYWGAIREAEAKGDMALAESLRKEPKMPSGHSSTWAGSIGGPVVIPRVYDGRNKLFFFFIYNGVDTRSLSSQGSRLFSVPTAEQRTGDFSQLLRTQWSDKTPAQSASDAAAWYTIYDPLTTVLQGGKYVRAAFPGNIIPASRFTNPAYSFLEKFYPLPNNPAGYVQPDGTANYYTNTSNTSRYAAFQNRIDYAITDSDRMFARWSYSNSRSGGNDWSRDTMPGVNETVSQAKNKSVGLDYVHTFGARTVLNVSAAYNRFWEVADATLGAQGYSASDMGLPDYIDGYAGASQILPNVIISGYPMISQTYRIPYIPSVGTLKADVMTMAGKHNLKLGWDGRLYLLSRGYAAATSGMFRFNSKLLRKDSTDNLQKSLGAQWAALQLGVPGQIRIDTNPTLYVTAPYHSWYIQDKYRATNKLTLEFGLRVEWDGSFRERHNQGVRDFDFNAPMVFSADAIAAYARNPLPERPATDFLVQGGARYLGVGTSDVLTDPVLTFEPRFGFAYAVTPKLVIRGGYGLYADTFNPSQGAEDLNTFGYRRQTLTTITGDQGASWNYGYFTRNNSPMNDPFPIREDGSRFDIAYGNSMGTHTFAGTSLSYMNPDYVPPRVHRWRINIERELFRDAVGSIAYAAAKGTHIPLGVNLRPLPEQYWAAGNERNNAVASDLNRTLPNPFYIANFPGLAEQDPALYAYLGTQSLMKAKTISRANLLRAYPHMTGLTLSRADRDGKSSYHSFVARFDKRMSKGWTVSTHYTWSHDMEKTWLPNEFDTLPIWREGGSRPHRWVVTSILELPFGKGRRLLNQPGILRAVLGGWQIGAVGLMQSGSLLSWGNLFFNGDDYRDIRLSPDQRNEQHWFNTSGELWEKTASRQPANFHRRVFPSTMSWLRAPARRELDGNLQKSIQINDRFGLNLRLDMMNVLNHQSWAAPSTSPTSATFGQLLDEAITGRTIQLYLKLAF